MYSIDFGLVLNLHQPTGNLDELLDNSTGSPRCLWEYEDVGR